MYANYHLLFRHRKAQLRLWFLLVIAMGIGLLPMLSNFANLGALFGGLLGGAALQRPIAFSEGDARRKRLLRYGACVLFLTALAAGLGLFFSGKDASGCTWCRWIDCIPPNSDWCANGYVA